MMMGVWYVGRWDNIIEGNIISNNDGGSDEAMALLSIFQEIVS